MIFFKAGSYIIIYIFYCNCVRVGSRVHNLVSFLAVHNFVNFRNTKKRFGMCGVDVSVQPPVKFQLLMSSQRVDMLCLFWGLVISWSILDILYQVLRVYYRVFWVMGQKFQYEFLYRPEYNVYVHFREIMIKMSE